jgi:molybdopterin/thiamine biosynthesis adenylyltransferase
MALAAAGVGYLGLLDSDTIELSNLPRQPLYKATDVGRPKAVVAAERLANRHPQLVVKPLTVQLDASNFTQITAGFDFIVDGTDQVASKYLINDGAVRAGIPFVHAGVVGFRAQLMTVLPQRSACLRCLFPVPPRQEDVPTCQESGVLGGMVGCFGFLQAGEAIKYFTASHQEMSIDRLLTYDGARERWHSVPLKRSSRCPLCGETATPRTGASSGRACSGG